MQCLSYKKYGLLIAFQSQVSQMMSAIHTLIATERKRLQDLEQVELEKQELMELMKGLQKDYRLIRDGSKKATSFRPVTHLASEK